MRRTRSASESRYAYGRWWWVYYGCVTMLGTATERLCDHIGYSHTVGVHSGGARLEESIVADLDRRTLERCAWLLCVVFGSCGRAHE